MAIKVRIWSDRYAPGMYQLRACRDDVTRKIRKTVRANGGPWDKSGAALCESPDDLNLSDAQLRDLDNGWDVIVLMDPWEFAHFYGYNAHEAFGPA